MSNQEEKQPVHQIDQKAIIGEIEKMVDRISRLTSIVSEIQKEEDTVQLLKDYKFILDQHETLNAKRKKLFAALEFVSRNVIPEIFMDKGVKSMNLDDIGLFVVGANYSVKVLDDDKSKEWLKANGGEDLIKQTVNSSSLKAWMKAFKEEKGVSPPDDIYAETQVSYTQIRKR